MLLAQPDELKNDEQVSP